MQQIESIVEELKIATGWKDISYVGESFVINLDINDMRCIKGLKQGNGCLYLEFEDFRDLPVSFVVTVGNTVHQYWTLGRQLHRTGDRPAYVAYEPDKDRIIRRWFWNGLKHRVAGPAREMIKGYTVADIEGIDGFYQESWEYMSMEWFQEGFSSKFPYCSEATIERGQRIKNKETNRIQSPRGDLSAYTAERCEFIWDTRAPQAEFKPTSAEILELSEVYDEEGFKSRTCTMCDFNWRRGSTDFFAADHTAFNEEFKGELFSIVDLWGKFYKDEEAEFLVISEFNRITEGT
jgi:hypothetical protein